MDGLGAADDQDIDADAPQHAVPVPEPSVDTEPIPVVDEVEPYDIETESLVEADVDADPIPEVVQEPEVKPPVDDVESESVPEVMMEPEAAVEPMPDVVVEEVENSPPVAGLVGGCLLYTSDAADE